MAQLYTALALPDESARLARAGVSPQEAVSRLACGVELRLDLEDVGAYERYADDVRARGAGRHE